jgi:hypothetical protein
MQWNNPKSTQQQIADYFSIFGELPVKHRTVEDTVCGTFFFFYLTILASCFKIVLAKLELHLPSLASG